MNFEDDEDVSCIVSHADFTEDCTLNTAYMKATAAVVSSGAAALIGRASTRSTTSSSGPSVDPPGITLSENPLSGVAMGVVDSTNVPPAGSVLVVVDGDVVTLTNSGASPERATSPSDSVAPLNLPDASIAELSSRSKLSKTTGNDQPDSYCEVGVSFETTSSNKIDEVISVCDAATSFAALETSTADEIISLADVRDAPSSTFLLFYTLRAANNKSDSEIEGQECITGAEPMVQEKETQWRTFLSNEGNSLGMTLCTSEISVSTEDPVQPFLEPKSQEMDKSEIKSDGQESRLSENGAEVDAACAPLVETRQVFDSSESTGDIPCDPSVELTCDPSGQVLCKPTVESPSKPSVELPCADPVDSPCESTVHSLTKSLVESHSESSVESHCVNWGANCAEEVDAACAPLVETRQVFDSSDSTCESVEPTCEPSGEALCKPTVESS
jgi:hypothetical protein